MEPTDVGPSLDVGRIEATVRIVRAWLEARRGEPAGVRSLRLDGNGTSRYLHVLMAGGGADVRAKEDRSGAHEAPHAETDVPGDNDDHDELPMQGDPLV